MSVLRTRICGFLFEMRPATGEEIASHRATSQEMGWALCSDYSRATVGRFVSETGNVMDLPYELRTTRMIVNPSAMLEIFADDVEDFKKNIEFFSFQHANWCDCDKCIMVDKMFNRRHQHARGEFFPSSKFSGRIFF